LNEHVFVEDCKINIFGDLEIKLSNGNIFEAIVDSSSGDECWRLFEKNSKEDHFVMKGNRLVYEYDEE